MKLHIIFKSIFYWVLFKFLKGTAIKIEKALINDYLSISKVPWESRIPNIYNIVVIYREIYYFLKK